MDDTQEQAFQDFVDGYSLCITGMAGCGKSYLIQKLKANMELHHETFGMTAMTGSAAVLLGKGAKTLHSWAGIGLGTDDIETTLLNIRGNRKALDNWLTSVVLIIDEASMLTAELFDKLDTLAKLLRRNSDFMGGIQLVLVGDFFQLPPIGKEVKFCFESPLFASLKLVTLTHIHRQTDEVWKTMLNEIRKGECSPRTKEMLLSRMVLPDKNILIQPTKLFCRRVDVDALNIESHNALPGPEFVYKRTIESKYGMNDRVQKAVLVYEKNVQYYPILPLKIGDQVMLVKNITDMGLCNGSRGVVVGFDTYPIVLFHNGVQMLVPPMNWEVDERGEIIVKQLPLRLAYAITIHKSQGMTMDCAEVDIGNGVFEYGQSYVALSRLRSLDGLYLIGFDERKIRAHPKVKHRFTLQ